MKQLNLEISLVKKTNREVNFLKHIYLPTLAFSTWVWSVENILLYIYIGQLTKQCTG